MDDPNLLEPGIDPSQRKVAVRAVSGRNDGGTRTVLKVRDFAPFATDEPDTLGGTNTSPSPLETVLAALVGCDCVIINGVAQAMDFAYAGVDLECTGQIDVRGPKGVKGVRPYVEAVDITLVVYTDEPAERFEKLRKNVEFRCPVMNLLRDAGVTLNAGWEARPEKDRPVPE